MQVKGLPCLALKHRVLCLLFLLPLTPLSAQTITFSGVPSNVTVQCLSDIPGTTLGFTGVIPFALFGDAPDTNLTAGSIISITRQSAPVGNPGKLDESSCAGGSWSEQMIDGVPCQVSVGDQVGDIPGYTGITQGFQGRLAANPIVIMPIVSSFGGSHIETVVGFVNAQILSVVGSGNYTITIKLLSGLMTSVTATSSCGGATNVVFSQFTSGPSNNCSFEVVRFWTVTDACHHTASATQRVVVADTTPPAFTCPPDVTTNADPGACTFTYNSGTVVFEAATITATDNCGGNVFITNNAPVPPVFPKGTNFVIWIAADICGNSTTCTEKVVVLDLQAPRISCPTDIVINANNPAGTIVTFPATATDNCDGSVPVICTPASGSTFGIGTTLVNCVAIDSSSNQASCSFTITVAMDPNSFQILSVAPQGNDILLSWVMPQGFTGIVQSTVGDGMGGYSNAFNDVSAPIFVPGTGSITTNYLDAGVATNFPARYYRVRLVP